ncbi:hypothetical protein [Nocardia sp. NPDC050435]|uniref:hypothetical protein n=1 Tax=Nocardia sp. NPDC050435 TaxID=3155040 RepID=UPI0033DFB753
MADASGADAGRDNATAKEAPKMPAENGENSDSRPIEFSVRLRIRERPVGTELFSAISSVSLLLVTYVLMRILASHSEDVHTDVVVAIIALPATLAAMAVFFIDAIERSLFVSPAGMSLTFLIATLAATNMTVFAIQATDHHAFSAGFWYFSLAVAVVLAVASVGTFLIRLIHYNSSLSTRNNVV